MKQSETASAARRRVRLLIDAGWMFDWIDPDPAPPDFFLGGATVRDAVLWQHARTFWGATFDPACEACGRRTLDVSLRSGLVSTRGGAATGADLMAAAWRQQAEDSLVDVSWLFSGDISYHVLVDSFFGDTSGGLAQGPAGSTLRELIGRFWADRSPERTEF